MPLLSKNPTIIDGVEYPYLALNIAVSPLYKVNDVGGSIALRFIPYRVDEAGNIIILNGYDRVLVMLDVFSEGTPEQVQITRNIMGQIQELVNLQGY